MCLIACTANIHKECAAQPESWSVIEWCLEWYTCPAECVTLTRQSCCQDAMMFQRIFCLQCTCLYFALGLVAKHVATLCQLLALGNMCIAREWCHNRNYQRDIPWTKKHAAAMINLWIAGMRKGPQNCSFHPHIQRTLHHPKLSPFDLPLCQVKINMTKISFDTMPIWSRWGPTPQHPAERWVDTGQSELSHWTSWIN